VPILSPTRLKRRRRAPGIWNAYRRQRQRDITLATFEPQPHLWPDTGLHAAWLGHSTVLLKIDGFTILTDPVLGDRCGISLGNVTVGLKRLVAPALQVEELPHIDLILLSHAHMDHFDKPTLRALDDSRTSVVTAQNTQDLLRWSDFKEIREVAWDEQTRIGPAAIRGVQVNHWGARMHTDTYRGYNGYLLELGKFRVVFGGDTALTRTFRTLKTSRPVDLAIMPVGAYNPWLHVHCNPEQATEMANDCGAEFLLPVHHQTFHLSREPYREPIERTLSAAAEAGRVIITDIGQEWRQP